MSANSIIKKSGSKYLKLSPDLQTLPPWGLYYSIHVSTAIEFGIAYSTSDCIKLVGCFFQFLWKYSHLWLLFPDYKGQFSNHFQTNSESPNKYKLGNFSRLCEMARRWPCHLITINAALIVLNSEQLLSFGAKVSLCLSSQDSSVAAAVNTA